MDRRRQAMFAIGAMTLALTAVAHPTANIRVMTHDIGDTAPRRFAAAVDLGLMGVSVLVTWTARTLR